MSLLQFSGSKTQIFSGGEAVAKEQGRGSLFGVAHLPPRKRSPASLEGTMDDITYNPGLNPGEQRDAKEKVLHHGRRVS